MTPEQVVDLQLRAYNARDIDAFVATYADNARIFGMTDPQPLFAGKDQIRKHYGCKTFTHPGLRAEILLRITSGNKVIDLERTSGLRPQPFTGPVIYEVHDNRIQNVWFIDPDAVALPGGGAEPRSPAQPP